MPESKKVETTASTPSASRTEPEPAAVKPRPGESTDPAVQQLIARRQDHQAVLDSLEINHVEVERRRKQLDEIDAQLREMGYEVG